MHIPRFAVSGAVLTAVLILGNGCTPAMNLLAGEPLSNAEGAQVGRAPPGIDGHFEWSGIQAGVQGRTTLIARTEQEWQDIWNLAATPAPGSLPQGWMGIGIFLGMRQTAGYGVAIEGINEQITTDQRFTEQGLPASREMVISYGERIPAPGTMNAQVLTSPYVIRIVPRSDWPTRFVQTR
jgi:PrcB C-terminal